jgi:hypothetical protein
MMKGTENSTCFRMTGARSLANNHEFTINREFFAAVDGEFLGNLRWYLNCTKEEFQAFTIFVLRRKPWQGKAEIWLGKTSKEEA